MSLLIYYCCIAENSYGDESSSKSFADECGKSKDGEENAAGTRPAGSNITKDVALKDCVRIATVDNFQVSCWIN